MVLKLTGLDVEMLQNDILLNKSLTNVSPSNMYEILFDSETFDKVFNSVLDKLSEQTQSNLDAYVKNLWGYIQSKDEPGLINFSRNFKDQIIIPSNYSFIYLVNSLETCVHLNVDEELNRQVILNEGDLLVFKTEDFIKEESISENRIALVGSVALIRDNIEPVKKALI